jgi:AcrR family transcriptional regulator
MAQACTAEGYGAATVASVTTRAGVSRKTFYEQFTDKEECFLAAYDAILGRFLRAVIGAYEPRDVGWPERVRAAVATLLASFAAEPAFAWMCMVDVLTAGPRAVARYESAIRLIASLLDEGRTEAPAPDEVPAHTATTVVTGGAVLIRDRILAGRTEQLPEILPDIVYAALVPYLGQEQALHHAMAAEREGTS